jgi:VIT1/CCC1 family predicted Fe2+/Mn2+ transporter
MDPFIVRNIVYGLTDSLISTTGALIGVTFAGFSNAHVVITGIVVILTGALSMGFGAFLSEETFMVATNESYILARAVVYAAAMFASYVAAGVVVMLPFVLHAPHASAWSIALSIVGMFLIVAFFQNNVPRALAASAVGAAVLGLVVAAGRWIDQKTDLKSSPVG